ncbi:hypothetical protein AAH991_30420 [Microbispora sp. ZYX-F-249]|uniref:Uncharacterized protein n=1 Tax=Microbispora maris TaxID=3144104 RepID=A0ABV0B0K0_9ACTN
MLQRDDQLDAVEGQQDAQQQGVSDGMEPLLGSQMNGVVQVAERVVPVEPGGRVAEHRDHPERGRGGERDREEPVPPYPDEHRKQGTSVCGHDETVR